MERINLRRKKADKVLEIAEVFLCTIGAIGLGVMAFVLGVGIISRYAFNHPIPGVYDIVQLLMVWVVFLSLAYTQRMRRHIRVEILLNRLNPKGKNYLDLATFITGFAFCAIMSWQTGDAALESLLEREYWPGLLRTPMYPSKIALFAGILMLTFRFFIDAKEAFKKGRKNN